MTNVEEVVVKKKMTGSINDRNNVRISIKEAKEVVSVNGGIEGLLKTLPSVNSNTELSSQYMVRGGNYDENLIYINDVEIYRPFLIRNSQQEGMSIINPDMVSAVNFSAGGFEAKYGDRMSSALNISYREPEKFEVSVEGSLIGGRLTNGLASKNRKITALFSVRYRNTNLILNTLNEHTDFNPTYWDFQSFLNYHVSDKFTISFLGYYSKNDYQMIPRAKSVTFGSLQQPITINIGYEGHENDQYKNMMGTFSLNYKPTDKWKLTVDAFTYQNREREYYTIHSQYELQTFDPITQQPMTFFDVGGQIEHARNDLFVRTQGTQFRAKFSPNVSTDFEVGYKYEKENLKDFTNEWKLVDSAGYSIPGREVIDPRTTGDLKLSYYIAGQNNIEPTRLSSYAQYSQKFYLGANKVFVNAGVRVANWSFNKETIFSPRVQFAIKPDWDSDMMFKISGGIYYQSPFYKEIKDLDGNFNSNIKSQRSIHVIFANDYDFKIYYRPFKLTTEMYYKNMDNLIPYYMDNVRIRYSGQNNSKGYAYGIETRLFGEFVRGLDSWFSASYSRIYENIEGKGYIPKPTDQRLRFAMFYQDYMPNFPSMRVNLSLIFAMGLPTGAPVFTDRYQFQKKLMSYKRVDIGLSKIFISTKGKNKKSGLWGNFEELTLGLQVFNVFNINNSVANQWVSDYTTSRIYPVPVYLTGRFFNIKLEFKI